MNKSQNPVMYILAFSPVFSMGGKRIFLRFRVLIMALEVLSQLCSLEGGSWICCLSCAYKEGLSRSAVGRNCPYTHSISVQTVTSGFV